MKTIYMCLLWAPCLLGTALMAQPSEDSLSNPVAPTGQPVDSTRDKVFKMYIGYIQYASTPDSVDLALSPRFDTKRVNVFYAFEDTMNALEDLTFDEDPMDGPDCFIPEMKLVFESHTYLVSLYCTAIRKYKNAARWKPSRVRVKNDLPFTETLYAYLTRLRDQHIGPQALSEGLLALFVPKEELADDGKADLEEVERALRQREEEEEKSRESEAAQATETDEFKEDIEGEEEGLPDAKEADDAPADDDPDDFTPKAAPRTLPPAGTQPAAPTDAQPATPANTQPATTPPAEAPPASGGGKP